MAGWEQVGLRALPDTAPADVLVSLGSGVLKPRQSSGLCDVQTLGGRWAVARVTVQEYQLHRSEYRRDGLRAGDTVLLADGEHGVLHPPALVLALDPDPDSWPHEDNLLVEATVLVDRSHEPVALTTLPSVLGEAATWSTGAGRDEMRGCLLDLWGLDLTCPRCSGRGGRIGYGLRLPSEQAANPDEELILGGCEIEPFMHRYACRYCHSRWGGAPRFADPELLDLAIAGGVVRAEDLNDHLSTPVPLRWLNTLLDGVEELLAEWSPYRMFTEFDSRYGRTVGMDLNRGDDFLELEYNADGSRVSGWDLSIETEGEPPQVSFTLTPASSTVAQAIQAAGMFNRRAVILGWNPSRWDDWDPPYEQSVDRTGRGEILPGQWSVANRRTIPPGTEVFLLLQGTQHGMIGHGITTDWPFPAADHTTPGQTRRYVPVEWHQLLPVESRIGRDLLERDVPNVKWRSIRSSGWPVPDDAVADLRAVWQRESASGDPRV